MCTIIYVHSHIHKSFWLYCLKAITCCLSTLLIIMIEWKHLWNFLQICTLQNKTGCYLRQHQLHECWLGRKACKPNIPLSTKEANKPFSAGMTAFWILSPDTLGTEHLDCVTLLVRLCWPSAEPERPWKWFQWYSNRDKSLRTPWMSYTLKHSTPVLWTAYSIYKWRWGLQYKTWFCQNYHLGFSLFVPRTYRSRNLGKDPEA